MIIGFLNLEAEGTAILLWSNTLLHCWGGNQLVMEYAKQLPKFDKGSGQLTLKNLSQMPQIYGVELALNRSSYPKEAFLFPGKQTTRQLSSPKDMK